MAFFFFFTVEIHLNNFLVEETIDVRVMWSLSKLERTPSSAWFSARLFLTFSVNSNTSEEISRLGFQGRMTSPRLHVVSWQEMQIWPQPLCTQPKMGSARPERNPGSPKMLQQVTLVLSRTHYPLTKQWRWDLCFFSFEWNIPEWCMGSSR